MTDDKKTPPLFTVDTKQDKPIRVEFPVRAALGAWPGPRGREASSPYRTPEAGPADTTHAPARNPIDEMAEFEYAPAIVPPDRLPSPGAALRQLCRSIDAHPNLKRLIEDHLAKCNTESQGHYRQTEALKEQLAYAQDELGGLARENTELCKTVSANSAFRVANSELAERVKELSSDNLALRAQLETETKTAASLTEESNRLIKKLTAAVIANKALRAQVAEYQLAHERQKQLMTLSGSTFLRALKDAHDAEAEPSTARPDLDAMGRAAHASHLSLSHKPRSGLLARILPTRPPLTWEALDDMERAAWCAAALAAALERDMGVYGVVSGQKDGGQ
jgi:hypothetical protein